jgi:periplasmic protein TonB
VNSGLTTTLFASILLHLLGLTALSMVGGSLRLAEPPSSLIPTEMLVEPPPPVMEEPVPPPEPDPVPPQTVEQPEPVPPPPAPEPQPVTPPKLEKVIPPKLVEKPMPERVTARPKPTLPVPKARPREPASPPPGKPQAEPPGAPLPTGTQAAAAGNVMGPPMERPPDTPPQPVEGGEAGAGKLFDKGDLGVVPGSGAGGGSGGPGRAGLGTGGAGASGGTRVAGLPPGAGLGGDSSVARPLGGYQVKPRYPESARRQGFEGTTLLKIHVSERGMVEDVLIERSTGYQDLDLAAMEAVKQWRFEPARQGNRPVAVWVMLPVRFALK